MIPDAAIHAQHAPTRPVAGRLGVTRGRARPLQGDNSGVEGMVRAMEKRKWVRGSRFTRDERRCGSHSLSSSFSERLSSTEYTPGTRNTTVLRTRSVPSWSLHLGAYTDTQTCKYKWDEQARGEACGLLDSGEASQSNDDQGGCQGERHYGQIPFLLGQCLTYFHLWPRGQRS